MDLRVIFTDPSIPVASAGAPRHFPNPGSSGGVSSGRRLSVVDTVGTQCRAHGGPYGLFFSASFPPTPAGGKGSWGGQRGDIPPAAGFIRLDFLRGRPGLHRLGHDPGRLVLVRVARG